ncbi:MAG: FAD dependent oxidoreductase [Parcubacteria group bacterium GW2011_GWF2_45_11]|nr:MAG: FAD dependent oxidoreductase [Parcubacteria group bacterium GW2011_GWF2_45_11]OGW68929.1 MAG: FAD-dependent oxidoreductase [Omnitrophica bacterium GWA2_50_21]
MITADFLVIGGGIVGINVARELNKKYSKARVVLIEKENQCGEHASGRNSGVLHAGFYYTADSLKAKFTRLGNQLMTEYCLKKKLPLNRCGKLVVAKDAADLAQLDELLRRGAANGVPLEAVTEQEAMRIEPRVKTFARAIFSPTTSSVDPVRVTLAMKEDAVREGVEIKTGVCYLKKLKNGDIQTSTDTYSVRYVVNSAGLYADKIAVDFGFSEEYRILPFKGLYLYSEEPAGAIRTNIYPVPDLRNPFLGVHFTVTVDGHAKIGPTAIPAFWREQYSGFGRFKGGEFFEILKRQTGLFFLAGFDFRKLAAEEIQKCSRARIVSLAALLLRDVRSGDYQRWGRPGIRAQLVHIRTRRLEMDFVIQGDNKSLHILNAVSPGFTCAIPFSRYVCDRIDGFLNSPWGRDENINRREYGIYRTERDQRTAPVISQG